jgi:uncharacterized membrane protein YGL010W
MDMPPEHRYYPVRRPQLVKEQRQILAQTPFFVMLPMLAVIHRSWLRVPASSSFAAKNSL